MPLLADLNTCLAFFSRLPVRIGPDAPPLRTSLRLLPVAGLVIGACTALPLWLADRAGLPPALAASVALTCGVLATGGLHEDGLADTADGLGGGASRERKLAIMRDSRIGTYGVLALVLSLALRIAALAPLVERHGAANAALAVLGAAALTRALALLPIATLPPARPDGLGRGFGRPAASALATCFGLALLFGLGLPIAAGFGGAHALVATLLSIAAAAAMTRLASLEIGGHTGDIAGACQQVAEAAFLIGLVACPGPL